jgi:glucose/arabinose dehydrogenase
VKAYTPSAFGKTGETALTLPSGFQVQVYARDLNQPRFMTVAPDGVVFVAERGAGRIVALRPPNDLGGLLPVEAEVVVVASGLSEPASVWREADGHLLVGETTRVTRLTLGPDLRSTASQVVIDDLPFSPTDAHRTRTVVVGADGRLYVAVGSSCNACNEADPRRAAISVYDADGGGGRLYARGLRNAVGLTVAPLALVPNADPSGVWATVMGRGLIGDDLPPETIYEIYDGLDAGWPRCHAGRLPDPDFGSPASCSGVAAPAVEMQAHEAPLALLFYTGDQFPPEYRGDLFVALHGSWNRSAPVGYKVVRISMDGATPSGPEQDFVTGWLAHDAASGRPAGLAQMPDGSLLVSDDQAGLVYRVWYEK